PAAPTASIVRMQFVGSTGAAQVTGLDPQQGRSNYFVGSTAITDVGNFGRVEYQGVYSGVDVVFHGNPRELQYDFIVAAGADPGQVKLNFAGADQLSLDQDGNLIIEADGAQVVAHAPFLYQDVNGVRQPVAGHYVLLGGTQAGVSGGEDATSHTLGIDPTLTYSTYVGGNNTDQGFGVAVDSAGNAYVTGIAFTPSSFPVSAGAFNATGAGNFDVFVTKLNATGTARVYSTYIGGSNDDRGFG